MCDTHIPPPTEEEKATWPATTVVHLEKPFIDARGEIRPLVDTLMRSAVLITSVKGSLRANHYHRTDWHYCYLLSGCMEYYHRPTGSQAAPEKILAKAGDMIFTPPLVDHSMVFVEDTTFLTLSRNPRNQEAYEADVVRTELINPAGLTSWKPGT